MAAIPKRFAVFNADASLSSRQDTLLDTQRPNMVAMQKCWRICSRTQGRSGTSMQFHRIRKTLSITMAAIPKRFAVFKAGYASGYTETKYGGYAEMLANLFKDPGDVWDIYAVIDGKFPSQKELDGYDGFVITGSSADAHGNNEWILKLCDVINYLFDRHKKVLGICFGHQEEVANEAMLSFKDRQPDQEILKNFCKLFLKRQ